MPDDKPTTPTTLPARRGPGRPRIKPIPADAAPSSMLDFLSSAHPSALPEPIRNAGHRAQVMLLMHALGWGSRKIASAFRCNDSVPSRLVQRYDPEGVLRRSPDLRKALATLRWYQVESQSLARVESADLSATSPAQALTMAAIARDKLIKLEESARTPTAQPGTLRLRIEAALVEGRNPIESRFIESERTTSIQPERADDQDS